MKRIVYILLLFCIYTTSLRARTPIRQWFTDMPDSIMPLLTKNNRLDFIDFIDSHMDAIVTNRLDGKSRMTQLTEDYLHIEYTQSSSVTMKLLPTADTTQILCMVTTTNTAARDSRITFFSKDWQPLKTSKFFIEPQNEAFLTNELNDSAQHAREKLDIHLKSYTLSPQDCSLTCHYTTLDYLSSADKEYVKPYIHEELIYEWNGKKFVLK